MGQELYKKMYSVKELYVALYKGFRTMKYMRKNKKSNAMTKELNERIMLAVTEVNGCEVCSYAHTKMALELGMPIEEIQTLLSGNTENIPADEAIAILFAQHYADTRGNPSSDSWKRVVDAYGMPKALGILGTIRIIMIGNVSGIALSAFRSRLKGNPIKKSNLFYEISMLLATLIFLPFAFIHGLVSDLFKIPVIRFS